MKNYNLFIFLFAFMTTLLSIAQSEITQEEIQLKNDSIHLPGTLRFHKEVSPQALVIYVHGSGNVDRNGNQAGAVSANYIQQLAEALNQNNIAFYSYDKRTATKENMPYLMQGVSFYNFVEDVQVAINHFTDDVRFSSIHLIGHSQGSLVAMLALSDKIDSYISIAGPASAIDEMMIAQLRKQNGDEIANLAASHFEELKADGKIETVNPMLFQLFNPQNQPFFLSWMQYHPTEEMKKVSQPTLIINGTKDIQVPVEEAEALHKANPTSTLVVIESMNHVLKAIEKDEDNFKSYTTPDFPLAEELVTVISDFVKK